MAIKPLEEQRSGNQDLELMMQDIKAFVKVLEDNPMLDGRLIEDVDLGAGVNTTINHGLGRKPRGWFFTNMTAAAVPLVGWISWDDKTLVLLATAAANVDLWVF